MLRLLWILSVHARSFLRRYMLTNWLLDAIRTRRGLKWGIPAMLLAIPYLLAAAILRNLIEGGGPEGLHPLVLLCIWSAMKLTVMAPVSVIRLVRARAPSPGGARRTAAFCAAGAAGEDQVPSVAWHVSPGSGRRMRENGSMSSEQ